MTFWAGAFLMLLLISWLTAANAQDNDIVLLGGFGAIFSIVVLAVLCTASFSHTDGYEGGVRDRIIYERSQKTLKGSLTNYQTEGYN